MASTQHQLNILCWAIIGGNTLSNNTNQPIQIAGAGPSGLAAAITLARAGRDVVVHETHNEVGHRFQCDFQGLENWTTYKDALIVLKELGIENNFTAQPFLAGTVFDAWSTQYKIQSEKPLFYLIERGPGPNSLDTGLLKQAIQLGVEVKFNSRLKKLDGIGILAAGPKVPDAIAVGYHFQTKMDDGYWVICDDDLAPEGYAYLLVMSGQGTVKTCMFSGFKNEKTYINKTVKAFEKLVGLEMINPVAHGGAGNFRIPNSAYSGIHPVIGEQAGFQDTLWGFGIRLALSSGILAAQSLLNNENYDLLWKRELRPQMQAAVVNRAFYGLLGNKSYRWFLRKMTNKNDIRGALRKVYSLSLMKKLLLPWANKRYISRRKDVTCNHINCHCVWCRQCAT